ncbi:outer membrane-specific lipoprotein transporter subunit LolC [Planctomycetes bacterium Poly30]|uniref:Outer membrane-specific lipoprotein transporter subunit LolC n=2 Tax=Saltatorellus ferox TaxID=2528018 RepID=A0A518EMR2_9BACT|nr:outer membrane-specific lipoprotein transporter subunit LolC [Planctomycetes bacterium Poly30]
MIVARSLRQHAVSTLITVVAAGLASGLVMSVFTVSEQSKVAFTGGDIGYDAVLGAKGSPLQLVLNTVYHLETSPGNIPWAVYEETKARPDVRYAIPYAVGDNLRGYRIVGTTSEIFDVFEYQRGKGFDFDRGRAFSDDRMEAVLGAKAAKDLGLDIGSEFRPSHGVRFQPGTEHAEVYVVTGVLEATNTPADQVVWIPIEGIYRMEGHKVAEGKETVERGAKLIPDEWKEVSAVMIKYHSIAAGMFHKNDVDSGKLYTLAWPIADVMGGFFNKMGWITQILLYVAYLVVVVAAFGLLASIYNTMNERRREFAILRALGARKSTVFSVIVLEAATIAFLGSLLGYAVYLGILSVATVVIRDQTGVVMEAFAYHPALLWTPVGMVVIGAFAGVFPAFKAYSTDVARTLA